MRKSLLLLSVLFLCFASSVFCSQEFMTAVRQGELEKIKNLYKKDQSVITFADQKGRTPLHEAADQGHFEIIKFLVENKAPLFAKDNEGKLPKDLAKKRTDAFKYLENVVAKNRHLIRMVKEGNFDRLEDIYKPKKMRGETKDAHGKRKREIQKIIDLNLRKDGKSLLHFAVEANNESSIRWLVLNDSKLLFVKDDEGNFPLFSALKPNVKARTVGNMLDHYENQLKLPQLFSDGERKAILDKLEDMQNKDGDKVSYVIAYLFLYIFKFEKKEDKKNFYEKNVKEILQKFNLKISNVKTWQGKTLLHLAALSGSLDDFVFFVKKFAEENTIDVQDKTGRAALYEAVTTQRQPKQKVLFLLKYGANKKIKAKVEIGKKIKMKTPKQMAKEQGKKDIVRILSLPFFIVKIFYWKTLQKKQPTEEIEKIAGLIKSGEFQGIKKMLEEKKFKVNDPLDDEENRIIHWIASSGGKKGLSFLKYLVEEKNANINVKNNKKQAPIFVAVKKNQKDIVKYLLEKGCKFKKMNLVTEAVKTENLELVKLLVEKGADVNHMDKNKKTALYNAVKSGFKEIVEYLLDNGANINVQTVDGYTPIHGAIDANRLDIAQLLKERGANLALKDEDDKTPYEFALEVLSERTDIDFLKSGKK